MTKKIKDGPVEYYHDNGQLQAEGTYKDGKLDGPLKSYYENGQIEQEGIIKDGEIDGPSKHYNENGKLLTSRVERMVERFEPEYVEQNLLHGLWNFNDNKEHPFNTGHESSDKAGQQFVRFIIIVFLIGILAMIFGL